MYNRHQEPFTHLAADIQYIVLIIQYCRNGEAPAEGLHHRTVVHPPLWKTINTTNTIWFG